MQPFKKSFAAQLLRLHSVLNRYFAGLPKTGHLDADETILYQVASSIHDALCHHFFQLNRIANSEPTDAE